MVHAARASHREQSGNRDFTLSAAASEADLAPLHGATQRSFGDVVGRLNTFVTQEGEELVEGQSPSVRAMAPCRRPAGADSRVSGGGGQYDGFGETVAAREIVLVSRAALIRRISGN